MEEGGTVVEMMRVQQKVLWSCLRLGLQAALLSG
jgi:hypothetical protein